MEPRRFDALARSLAAGLTRRRVVAAIAGLAGGGGVGLVPRDVDAGSCVDRPGRCDPASCLACDASTGRCRSTCDPGQCQVCDGAGGCVSRCTGDRGCSFGRCGRCPEGTVGCGGFCVDPASFEQDAGNCGACGVFCPTGFCREGRCCVAARDEGCVSDADCCDPAIGCSPAGLCCRDDGSACASEEQCCSGFCDVVAGVCCSAYGACTENAQCCPGVACSEGGTCCNPDGAPCRDNFQCCSSHCDASGTCCDTTQGNCCVFNNDRARQCSSAGDCCDDGAVCSEAGLCCRAARTPCFGNNQNCCNQSCDGETGTCCIRAGSTSECTSDADCCQAGAVCRFDILSFGICCLTAGAPCADGGGCCSGFCGEDGTCLA